jgi:hypothetical protein
MHISFAPQRRDDALTVSKAGDVLTLNGDPIDLSDLPEGATLPAQAVDCEWIAGDIERIAGEIHLTLLLPHGPGPNAAVAFPEPITVAQDGHVAMPHDLQPKPIPAPAPREI